MAFFGITVIFIIQKLKTKCLVQLSFLRWQVFFEGTRENILHISLSDWIIFSGWRNLESSVKCVQALVNGCGDKFHLYVDQSLLDLIFTSLEHPNRFVRETAYQTCATIIEVCSGQEQINRRTGTNSKYFTRSTILIKKISKWIHDSTDHKKLHKFNFISHFQST